MNITLDDGRTELWQWDTGRKIVVDDKSVSEVHYSKYISTQAITREVIDGKAEIPNFLLQDTHAVTAYAYSGSIENGYTMAEKTFNVVKKPKPANYVETEEDKAILAKLKEEIGDLSELQTEAKDNLVTAINEVAEKAEAASTHMPQISESKTWLVWDADAGEYVDTGVSAAGEKGDDGDPGKAPIIGSNGNWYEWDDASGAYTDTGKPSRGEKGNTGAEGADGADGRDGITPTIGENGNWYLGETDTGKPSRGEDGATGATGATGEKGTDGKSAYAYAVESGYAGTETEFAAKLAEKMPTALPNPNALTFTGAVTGSYDGSAQVNVEIPSGGGRTLALIADVTTSEETNMISITQDSDGNAFSIKSWAAYIYIPAHERDTAKTFYARGTGYGGGMTFTNMLITKNQAIGFFLYPIANYDAQDELDMDHPLKVQYISSFGGNTADASSGFSTNMSIFQVYTNNIEVLFPAGVRVRLWGVRR